MTGVDSAQTSKPSRSRKWLRRLAFFGAAVAVGVGITVALQGNDGADEAQRLQRAKDACREAVKTEAGIDSGFGETQVTEAGDGYRVSGDYAVSGTRTGYTCDVDAEGNVTDVRIGEG